MKPQDIEIDHDLLGEMVETDPAMIRLKANLHTFRTQQLERFARRGGLNDKIKAKVNELGDNRIRIFKIEKNIQYLRKQNRTLQKANLRLKSLIAKFVNKRSYQIKEVRSLHNDIQRRRAKLRENARLIALRKELTRNPAKPCQSPQ